MACTCAPSYNRFNRRHFLISSFQLKDYDDRYNKIAAESMELERLRRNAANNAQTAQDTVKEKEKALVKAEDKLEKLKKEVSFVKMCCVNCRINSSIA